MTMHVNDKLISDRILKVRTEIILTNRFYGVLISNVEPVLSRKFPTAATNGKQHYFNPDFVGKLTQKQLRFVQRHESEHDARHHSTRRGGRDAKEWNICCDFAINIDLLDEIAQGADMEVPPVEVLGGNIYADAKYRGMSAEDIFRIRELDRKAAEQAKQQQQPQQDDADEEDDANQAGENADTDPGKDAGEDEGEDAGEEAGDEAGEEAGDEAGEAGDEGSEGKGDQPGGDTGEEAGDEAGEGKAGGKDGEDTAGDAEGEGTGGSDESTEGEGKEPSTVAGDMPGGLGEVLDATDDPAEVADEEAKWERVVRQAATIGKGDAPGHITREIERANQSKQNWREALRAYFDAGADRRETWNRPNRRFVGAGTILPGSEREGLNSVVFLIDTSGSCDDVALAACSVEAQAALDEGIISDLTVVYGDTQVTRVDQYVSGDNIEFDPRGGGGTAMRPLFDWTRDNVDNPSLVVCFTDGYIESEAHLGERPACPVLWAYHGYPEAVKGMIANAPWGEAGIDVGSH